MRKIMRKIFLFIGLIIISLKVDASSFTANIIGNDTFEDDITLKVMVNNYDDLESSTCKGICGLVGVLNYDTNKIELTSIKALENFDLTQGKKIVLYKTTGVASGTNILELKFKNKDLAKDETTTISLKNIVGSDGDKDISASNASKTIKFIAVEKEEQASPSPSPSANTPSSSPTPSPTASNNAKNNTTTKSSSKSQSTKTTGTSTKETKSSDNSLTSITLSIGSIEFSKDVLHYNVTVENNVTQIDIRAKATNDKAQIVGVGTKTLSEGINTFSIKVTAEDGSVKTYTINVTREGTKVEDTKKEEEIKADTPKEEETKESKNNKLLLLLIPVGVIGIVGAGVVIISKKK